MKIHFVTEGTLNEFWDSSPQVSCDVLVFGFNGLGEVDYGSELGGKTSKLEDVAILSREMGCAVIAGCYTDSCGIRRKSAAVAERGRILGVSDMLSSSDETCYKSGASLKVYDTAAGKIGLLIAEDLFFPKIAETLSLCDADVIVCVYEGIDDFVPQLMMRADAFVSGVAIAVCAAGVAQVASVSGEMAMLSTKKECDYSFIPEREYHIVSERRRGFYKKRKSDF